MKIGDTYKFFAKFDKKLVKKFQEQFGPVSKFLKPGDTFSFKCARDGKCCTNRFGKDQIILTPYDVARLRTLLKIDSTEFLKKCACLALGAKSQFPIALLKYQATEKGNKCPFLTNQGCSVYQDRPLRCRLYPLGRAYSDGYSYFYLAQVDKNCGINNSRRYVLEEWLSGSEVGPFCDWSDVFHLLFMNIDHEKYKEIAPELKYFFGFLMYDFDTHMKRLSAKNLNDNETMAITLDIAKVYLNKLGLVKQNNT